MSSIRQCWQTKATFVQGFFNNVECLFSFVSNAKSCTYFLYWTHPLSKNLFTRPHIIILLGTSMPVHALLNAYQHNTRMSTPFSSEFEIFRPMHLLCRRLEQHHQSGWSQHEYKREGGREIKDKAIALRVWTGFCFSMAIRVMLKHFSVPLHVYCPIVSPHPSSNMTLQ